MIVRVIQQVITDHIWSAISIKGDTHIVRNDQTLFLISLINLHKYFSIN